MKAVVLCGGQSMRMGTDKGLIKQGSTTWSELAFNKLASLQLPVLLSVNKQQYDAYAAIYQSILLVQDDDALNIGGPLKGILSVHLQEVEEDLMVLACDMPDMQTEVLDMLLAAWSNADADAIVFKNADSIEPLVAIYSSIGLQKVYNLYQKGELSKFSLHHVLSLLKTHYLPLPSIWKDCFNNINTPDKL